MPVTTLLLVLLGCAHSLGSSDLSADLSTGIGGLIVSYGPGPDPLAEEAWAKLRDTDAAFDALLAWPPMRWGRAGHDLERRFAAERALEQRLSDVVRVGAAEPGLPALVRLGRLHEANQAWLQAEPQVAPLFRSSAWAAIYPVLRPFSPRLPRPYATPPTWANTGCHGCPEIEKAIVAYELVARTSTQLGLLANADRSYALARLEALDPKGPQHRSETLPADGLEP